MPTAHANFALTGNRIRLQLRKHLEEAHQGGDRVVLIDEFALFGGQTRADLVALNGSLQGFEIKGESDTLARLRHQAKLYGKIFSHATLVTTPKHRSHCRRILPKWWGLWLAIDTDDGMRFEQVRTAQENAGQCSKSIARLLWREEALRILAEHGLSEGMRHRTLSEMVNALVSNLPAPRLETHVRETLKARGVWLPDSQPKRCGGTSRRRAMSLHSPAPLF